MSSLDEFDFDASIECSRGCFTLPLGDETSNSLFNTSGIMDECPGATNPIPARNNHDYLVENLDDTDGPLPETDSFNLTAFLEEYKKEDFMKNIEISSDEEDKSIEKPLIQVEQEEIQETTVPDQNEIVSSEIT